MSRSKRPTNPFYFLLVAAGVLFTITACAFFVMTLQDANPTNARSPSVLIAFMEQYGMTALIVELVALAVATVSAILTDDFWARRAGRLAEKNADESEATRGD